jgi:hypothetical protein
MVADLFWKQELKSTVGSSPITPTRLGVEMYYVKCCHCTVGIVETTATVKKIMGQVWTEHTPKNKLNGTAICDA